MTDDREEKPTVAIRRDVLLGLVAETQAPKPHAHTIRRDALAAGSHNDVERDVEPGVSPTLVLAVIALLIAVFIVATRLS